MLHRGWVCALAVSLAVAPPRGAGAQRLVPPRFTTVAAPALAPLSVVAAPLAAAARPSRKAAARPSKWPFVAVGAFLGVGAVAAYAKRYARTHEDCFCTPVGFAPHFAAGAAAGGLGGLAIYYARWGRSATAGARAP